MEGVQHAAAAAADAKVDELRMFGLARQGLTCWMAGGWWWFSCVCCKKGRHAKVSETEMRVESEKLLMFVLTFMTNFQCIPSPSFSFPSNAFLSGDEISIIGHNNKRRWRDRVPEVSFESFICFSSCHLEVSTVVYDLFAPCRVLLYSFKNVFLCRHTSCW